MNANNNQRTGRQVRGGPARGRSAKGGRRNGAPMPSGKMVDFSPKLGEMLLRSGATLSVTFDGAEVRTLVRLIDGTEVSLAVFLRNRQEASTLRAFTERKNALAARLVALGEGIPAQYQALSSVQELESWIALQQPNIVAALNVGSDNFRAFLRARESNQPATFPVAGLEQARNALNARIAAHGGRLVSAPHFVAAREEQQMAVQEEGQLGPATLDL